MEWIRVKDRVPEEDGEYLTLTSYGGGQIRIFPFIRRRFEDYEHEDFNPDPSDDVTHWMPLPQPSMNL